MRNRTFLQVTMVWVAAAGLCLPNLAMAVTPVVERPVVTDVALRDGGVLLGQVVKADGSALPSVPVALRCGAQEMAAGNTDGNGYFAFSGVRTGVYQVAAAGGSGTYRMWDGNVAPPGAQSGAVVVAEGGTVRGQHGGGGLGFLTARPILLGGLIGAAIAVPIAVYNANRTPASGN